MPIGAFAEVDGDQVTLTGLVASVDGTEVIKRSMIGTANEAQALGLKLAEQLLDLGAKEILDEVYGQE